MNFIELLYAAKRMDGAAFNMILKMFAPIIKRYSKFLGHFDEDLWQEQCFELWKCILNFRIHS